ncbi:hypothetical protein APUTEX25_004041 [Auxenochlorella protothecoides]|uniref:Helicase C-terminal domain-containing protein n=1 Tax=Auxenochlorella protothecoides TaxID=3075 RepID=A0A3M7L3P7_AUXPR|nr:hypothetical protein APUTEX25_004041 [Auxenochlorella protothecoides]|eukprot:RMZ57207.1 hypothetical protein APUTEX25_004041 [Auxenochlorella protothecoides]
MAGLGFKIIIADESHTLRTAGQEPDAYHTEATVSVAKRAQRAIFLTGTPSLSKPYDLFRQVDALRQGMLGDTRQQYAGLYCARRIVRSRIRGGEETTHVDNSGLRRAEELHRLLRYAVMLRRLKREVLAQLPPKRRQVVGTTDRNRDAHGLASVTSERGGGPKILVFVHHKAVMAGLADAMEGAGGAESVPYIRIDGDTDAEDRRQAAAQFQRNPRIRVALLSLLAAGVGLDFSAASAVAFAELPDEVGILWQAEARAHRQGLCWPVNIYFLCAQGSSDEQRWQRLHRSLARRLKIYCAQTGWCEEWRDVATPVQSSSAQTVVLPGIGLVALQPWVTPGILKAALAGAQAFVAEWRELRAVHAARLADAILGLPLSEAVAGLEASFLTTGMYGLGTSRYLDAQKSEAPPAGSEWRTVTVVHRQWNAEAKYNQAFLVATDERLCLNCSSVVADAKAVPAAATLDNNYLLFCR